MEAYQLQRAQAQEDMARLAWLNQQVQATTGSEKHPRPLYKRFEQFYDRKEVVDSIRSAYEPTYRTTSKKKQQQDDYDLFYKRIERYRRLKRSGKLGEIQQKGGKR